MSTGKLCGLAVIVVIICPVILGFCWPTGTEQVDTWEVNPAMDLTPDLANREIVVYDTYTGPMNNLTIYRQNVDALQFPAPRNTTTAQNAYPVSSIDSVQQAASVTISSLASMNGPRFGLGSSSGFTVTGEAGTFSYADYWPNTNVITLYDDQTEPVRTYSPKGADVIAAPDLQIISFEAPTEYMDLADGLAGSSVAWAWLNGLKNKEAEIWVRLTSTPFDNTIEIGGITITSSSAGVTASDGTTAAEIGSAYRFFRIVLNSDGAATVTGLIGVDSFQDPTYTLGNSVSLNCDGNLDRVLMKGAYMSWWVKRTVSAIGSTRGIENAAIVPDSYWPSHAWQLQIINPSTFGDALQIGALTLPVESGSVTVTDIRTGEASAVPVRGLRILSLVQDGMQRIYADGIPISEAAPQAVTIALDGQWYASVVLSEVAQSQHTEYRWNVGGFGFGQAAFCIVGLLACVGVTVAGSLWGRRTGEGVLALHITMILCGCAYLVMLM